MKEQAENTVLNYLKSLIKIASREESPDDIISELLRHLGEKLEADRAYVFEENNEGTFDNTYEWCLKGVSAEIDNLQGMPYENMLEIWYEEFNANSYIIISDVEEYQKVNAQICEILRAQNINSLIAAPVKNGIKRAFIGIDNPPIENMSETAGLLREIICLFELVLRIRENINEVRKMSMCDFMTGFQNRAALMQIYDIAENEDICVMMCDLNGLKKKNDTAGHRAGDKYICQFAEILSECFDKKCCYRIGGDEFLIVQSNVSPDEMKAKKQTVLEKCGKLNISVSMGFEFKEKKDEKLSQIMHRADMKMYEAKKEYYLGVSQDRRKQLWNDLKNKFEKMGKGDDL